MTIFVFYCLFHWYLSCFQEQKCLRWCLATYPIIFQKLSFIILPISNIQKRVLFMTHTCMFQKYHKISLNWMATSLISGMVDLFWIGTSKSKMYSFNLTTKMKCIANSRSPLTDITASDDDVMFLAKMQLFLEHVLVRILDIFLPKNFQHLCWCNFMQKIRNNALFFIKLTNAHFGPILECLSPKNFKKCFSSQKTNTSISVFNSYQSSVVFHIGTTPLIYTTTPGWNGLM